MLIGAFQGPRGCIQVRFGDEDRSTAQQPPTSEDDEVVIVDQDRIKELLAKLTGRSMYPKAITALFTGAGRGELLAMRYRYLDLDRNPCPKFRHRTS